MGPLGNFVSQYAHLQSQVSPKAMQMEPEGMASQNNRRYQQYQDKGPQVIKHPLDVKQRKWQGF